MGTPRPPGLRDLARDGTAIALSVAATALLELADRLSPPPSTAHLAPPPVRHVPQGPLDDVVHLDAWRRRRDADLAASMARHPAGKGRPPGAGA